MYKSPPAIWSIGRGALSIYHPVRCTKLVEKGSPSMNKTPTYETLDPENWDEMRALAHRMVDDAITYLQTVRERPVWQPVPEQIAETFKEPAPHEAGGADAAYDEFKQAILPYPMGNIHPRFWGWYMGNGTVFGALAEFMASVMNPNLG